MNHASSLIHILFSLDFGLYTFELTVKLVKTLGLWECNECICHRRRMWLLGSKERRLWFECLSPRIHFLEVWFSMHWYWTVVPRGKHFGHKGGTLVNGLISLSPEEWVVIKSFHPPPSCLTFLSQAAQNPLPYSVTMTSDFLASRTMSQIHFFTNYPAYGSLL